MQFFDKDCVFVVQVVDDEFVVYDFVMDIDWSVLFLQCYFDDFDCMVDIGVKVVWCCQIKCKGWFCVYVYYLVFCLCCCKVSVC